MPDSDSGVIDEPISTEPEPIWPEADRLCPSKRMPAYRHVRGVNPRPRQRLRAQASQQDGGGAALGHENWHESKRYLYGIDLYHAGYLWESHHVWEALEREAPGDSPESNLLQALLLNSKAQLKAHMGDASGVRNCSQAARWRLGRILSKGFDSPDNRFMGLDIADLLDQIRRHYSPAWNQEQHGQVRLEGPPPRLEPQESPAKE